MGTTYVVCVLNVDLGAIFSDFCLSSAIYCMGQNINHLQRVSVCLYICVCARTGLGAEYLGFNGTTIGNGIWRIDWSRDQ